MKKTFLSMLLVGGSCAVFAQTTDTVPTTTQPTTTQPTTTQPTTTQPTTTQPANQGTWNNTQGNVNTMNGSTPDDRTTLASTGQYSAYSAAVTVPTSVQTQFTREIPNASDVRWEQNANWYRATYKVGAHRMRTMYDMRGNSWSIALPVTNGLIPEDVIERAYTLYGDNVYDITILKTAPKAMTSTTATTSATGVDGSMNNNTSVNATTTTGNTTTGTNMNTSGTNNNTSVNAPTGSNMNAGTTMGTSTLNVGGTIYQVRVIENGVLRTERMNEDGTPYTEVYWRNDSLDVNQQNMNQGMDQQNWNNNQQQQTTTDTTSGSVDDGTMNMNNTNQQQSTTTDDSTDQQQAPSTPQSDSTNNANTDGTLPNSEPKLQSK